MAQSARPLRADAARNRARVLEVAYETFAAEGLGRADRRDRPAGRRRRGHRLPALPDQGGAVRAVIEDRMRASSPTGARCWSARTRRGAVRLPAVDGAAVGRDRPRPRRRAGRVRHRHPTAAPEAEAHSSAVLGELLAAAQRPGTARTDVGVPEVKAICWSVPGEQGYSAGAGRPGRRRSSSTVCARLAHHRLSLSLHSTWASAKNDIGTHDR